MTCLTITSNVQTMQTLILGVTDLKMEHDIAGGWPIFHQIIIQTLIWEKMKTLCDFPV